MTDPSGPASKREALKSTTIIGGASAMVLVIRMVRTKALALLLGPSGVGFEALYDSVLALMRTVFELGTSGSGVRQVVASASTGEPRRLAVTAFTLRSVLFLLGVLAAAALFVGRETASRVVFGDSSQATAFGWLSFAIAFTICISPNAQILQGMRRLGDLARFNIIGAACGAAISIPIVLVWGQAGIPAYMIAAPLVGLIVSSHFARKIRLAPGRPSRSEFASEARSLIAQGFAFLMMTVAGAVATLIVRALVERGFGAEGVGLFQAASALSLVFVGFILQAMGTDFFPRLTAAAGEQGKFNRMVNEQAEISLVLALPGILGTMAVAPWAIHVFYARGFGPAAEVLVWQMAGMLLRVMSWPLGYMAFAKGRGRLILSVELTAYAAYLAMAWIGLRWFGVVGAGAAFLGMYVVHLPIAYFMARRLSDFRWDPAYFRHAAIAVVAALAAMWMRLRWPEPWATLVPCTFAGVAAGYSLRSVVRILGVERVRAALDRFRLAWLVKYF